MTHVLGLRAALILLVLIAIAPVFAVVVQASLAEQRAHLQRAEQGLESTVHVAAAHQQRHVEAARQLLTAIASAPPVYGDDLAACADYLRRIQARYPQAHGTLGVLDPEGRLTCRSALPDAPVSSADRAFFRRAVETRAFSVGGFTVSRASGRQVLTFGLPVYREGSAELRGVAYLALDLERVGRQLAALRTAAGATMMVLDAGGIVLAASGPLAAPVGQPLPAGGFLRSAVEAGRAQLGRNRDANGREWLFALQPVGTGPEASPLFVAGLASSEAVLAPMERRLLLQLGALMLITLLGAGLAWAFAGHVLIRPMQRLLAQVDALVQEQPRLDREPPAAVLRELTELQGWFHDMARRLAERAVQRDGAMAEMEHQKDLLESVLQSMAEGVVVVDAQGHFVHVNEAAQRILPGLPLQRRGRVAEAARRMWGLDELEGVSAWSRSRFPLEEPAAGGGGLDRRFVVRGPLSGGRDIVVQASTRPLSHACGAHAGAVVVFSDVTEAWRAEQALRESEQRYRTLFDANPHPMWVYDRETLRFLTVNNAAVAHYGYSREDFLSMTIADIRPERDVEPLQRTLRELPDYGRPGVWLHRRKDGSMIHVEITSHVLVYDGQRARMVLANDITERLLAQEALQQLNETLERRVEERTRELALANQELESFSYSVSHDLRAPLQVIDGFARALATTYADRVDSKGQHYLARIRDNTRQMGQLIDDLLALARVTRTELVTEPFDLAVVAGRVVERLRQQFPDRRVEVAIDAPMPCRGDARLLGIVMENLVGNAWKFTSRVPAARIDIGRRREEGGRDVYYVADNGAGFDMEYADKLFKPFQRLHAASEFEGVGIGLATVHRIVTRHGGRVWARSEPGRGALFEFTLH